MFAIIRLLNFIVKALPNIGGVIKTSISKIIAYLEFTTLIPSTNAISKHIDNDPLLKSLKQLAYFKNYFQCFNDHLHKQAKLDNCRQPFDEFLDQVQNEITHSEYNTSDKIQYQGLNNLVAAIDQVNELAKFYE